MSLFIMNWKPLGQVSSSKTCRGRKTASAPMIFCGTLHSGQLTSSTQSMATPRKYVACSQGWPHHLSSSVRFISVPPDLSPAD